MPFQHFTAGGARGSGFQISPGIVDARQLHHGGKKSVQVFTVSPHQGGERFGVFSKGWNNSDIRKCGKSPMHISLAGR